MAVEITVAKRNGVLRKFTRRCRDQFLLLTSISFCAFVTGQAAAQTAAASAYEVLSAAATSAVALEFGNSYERIEIELQPPDPRVLLPVCESALETSVGRHNGQGGRLNVRVDCPDAAPWARNMAVNVKVFREVLVSSRNLQRGALISTADISMQEVDISQARGQLIEDPQSAVGMEVRRNISTGTTLSSDLLNAPLMVRRGDTIMLIAERAGISIRQQGTAMQDGESGRQITVRNTRSNRVVQAVVTNHGEAKVLF
jgi:flagella basal body P-ring formation protein FlgA